MATGHTSITHRQIRKAQKDNADEHHHPAEKIAQLDKFSSMIHGEILEVFGGAGNLTKYYQEFGNVTAMTKEKFGSSFDAIYKLRGDRKEFDVIDIDSYGYPDLFFPVVFEMMKPKALLVFTFPIVGVNCLNGIQEQHFITHWRSSRPTIGDVVGCLTDMGLRNWRLVSLMDVVKIKRIWRFAFSVNIVKATELCNVRNR